MHSETILCDGDMSNDWEITIAFTVPQYEYNEVSNDWKGELETLCFNAFVATILFKLDEWDNRWCTTIHNKTFDIVSNQARRRLMNQNDINVAMGYIVNDHLYSDYFVAYFNATSFGAYFVQYISNELGINIIEWSVQNPVYTASYNISFKNNNISYILPLILIIAFCGIATLIGIFNIIYKLFCNQKNPTNDEININKTMNHNNPSLVTSASNTKENKIIMNPPRLQNQLGTISEYYIKPMADHEVKTWLTTKVCLPQYFELFMVNNYKSLDVIKDIQDKEEIFEMENISEEHVNKIWTEIIILKQSDIDIVEEEEEQKVTEIATQMASIAVLETDSIKTPSIAKETKTAPVTEYNKENSSNIEEYDSNGSEKP